MERICVFAGSKEGIKPAYLEAASELGKTLAENKKILVYGGGSKGLMGELASGSLKAGGRVEGIITQQLNDIEVAHKNLSEIVIVKTMHERKNLMASKSDAIICLPGGVGTWEEVFEALAWNQLGIHSKPIIVLNISGYYKDLHKFIQNSVMEGFLPKSTYEDFFLLETITEAMSVLKDFKKKDLSKWNENFLNLNN